MKMLVISLSMAALCAGPVRAFEMAPLVDRSVVSQSQSVVESPVPVPEPSPALVLLGTMGILILLRLRR